MGADKWAKLNIPAVTVHQNYNNLLYYRCQQLTEF